MIGHIVLDVDGVIYNWFLRTREVICQAFNLRWQDCPHPGDWGMPWMTKEMWEFYDAHPELIFYGGKIHDGAREGIQELYDMTTKLTLLTHVPHGGRVHREAWLDENNLPYDELIMQDIHGDKSLVKGDLYIDDGLHNLERVHEVHPEAHKILMDRPWNRSNTTFLRARGWKDLVEKAGQIAEDSQVLALTR